MMLVHLSKRGGKLAFPTLSYTIWPIAFRSTAFKTRKTQNQENL
jgi:hypothetical protein